jgi:hypothetical protein
MTMRRNPRRTRRRIDPADMWEPLDPVHVKHSHAGQKPAPAPLLEPQESKSPEARVDGEDEAGC